ncbi:hypothetical protein HPP92_016779 [Vanilla planifolia]|uniref:Small auxin up regulated protein n=1 Tax=Vanilla planifolia TaxID=51239 RepID=A0A835QFX2_VANPL|nr:hypothetical protein HPP92_017383 [Vanilla planifolia]KAG0472233.1 hypothetical protein HPP92_016779 [Vanilla planifolia]
MNRIWQIVKLKRTIRRWRDLIRRRAAAASAEGVRPTRAGYAAVYVGSERRRFEIPAKYLNLPVIAELLDKAEEEFGGAQPSGGLSLPCEPAFFRWMLGVLARDESRFRNKGVGELALLFAELAFAVDCSSSAAAVGHKQSSPLLQRTRV